MGYFSVDSVAANEILPGVRQRVLCGHTGKLMMTYYEFKAGAEIPSHSHPHEQAGIVVKGEGTFVLGGEGRRFHAGDGWQVPPGVPHAVKFTTDAVVVETFTPPRDDFLT